MEIPFDFTLVCSWGIIKKSDLYYSTLRGWAVRHRTEVRFFHDLEDMISFMTTRKWISKADAGDVKRIASGKASALDALEWSTPGRFQSAVAAYRPGRETR